MGRTVRVGVIMERLIKSRIAHENGDVEYTVDVGKITVNKHGDGFMRRVLDKLYHLEEDESDKRVIASEWVSVSERLPGPFISVLVQMPGEKPCPTVREGFITDEGIWHSAFFDRKPGELGGWVEKEGNLSHDGNAWVSGNARVYGVGTIFWIGGVGSRNGTITFFACKDKQIRVRCGCFFGDLEQFAAKVKSTHGDNDHAKVYMMAIEMAKVRIKIPEGDQQTAEEG